jgi:hypothetical protein
MSFAPVSPTSRDSVSKGELALQHTASERRQARLVMHPPDHISGVLVAAVLLVAAYQSSIEGRIASASQAMHS